jgi:hypothetical protein
MLSFSFNFTGGRVCLRGLHYIEAAFAGDHKDRHGNLREKWRCPLCRDVPNSGGGGGSQTAAVGASPSHLLTVCP